MRHRLSPSQAQSENHALPSLLVGQGADAAEGRMMRLVRQYLARRRLAAMCRANVARLQSAPKRDPWGRFTKGKTA
jgi:hypothetical protein